MERGGRPGIFEALCILLALGLTVLALLGGLNTRTVNADDVALQNILDAWAEGGPRLAYVGSDNFLLHFPLYRATAGIADPGARLAVQAIVCNLAVTLGMIAVLRHVARFSRRTRARTLLAGYLPVLAWAALALAPLGEGDPVIGNYFRFGTHLNVNLRHLETGLWLLLLVAAYELAVRWRGGGRWTVAVRVVGWLAATVSMGLLFFSDPLFVYIGGGALVLALVTAWAMRRVGHVVAAGGVAMVVGAVVVMAIAGPIATARGLVPVSIVAEQFIHRGQLVNNSVNTLFGWFTQTHADFSGVLLADPAAKPIVVNLLLPILLVVAAGWGVRRFVRPTPTHTVGPDGVIELHLVLLAALSIAALTLTPNGTVAVNYRYLYVGVVALVPLAGVMLAAGVRRVPRAVVLVAAGLVAAIAVNAAASWRAVHAPNSSDATMRAVVAAARAEGLTKGYTNYWSANPTSWFSNREVVGIPLICQAMPGSEPRLARYDWLINRADHDRPATRTFILAERPPEERYHDLSCLDRVRLPRRVKVVAVDATAELHVYDGDVGRDWPLYMPGKVKK